MLVIDIVHSCNPTFYNFLIQGYVMKDLSWYIISTCGNKKLSIQKMMECGSIWLEVRFILFELDECLVDCVFWQDECETTAEEFMKKTKS